MSSPTNTPAILYESAQRTLAVASGMPRRRFPLPQDAPFQFAAYAFDQEFEMLLANFPPAPKNTPANAAVGAVPVFAGLLDGNAILTKLSQPAVTGGGRGKFTGSFARVPASWDDFQTQAVTFPGFDDFPWVVYQVNRSRVPMSRNVLVRMRHDYFVLDPAAVLAGAGVLDSGGNAITVVNSLGAIPIIPKQEWVIAKLVAGVWTPIPQVVATNLTPIGGFYNPVTSYHVPTIPSLDHYLTAVATAAGMAGAWTQTNPQVFTGEDADVAFGQYVLEASKLVIYEGNIIDRVTPYVLAL
jgi:hypothetical protein